MDSDIVRTSSACPQDPMEETYNFSVDLLHMLQKKTVLIHHPNDTTTMEPLSSPEDAAEKGNAEKTHVATFVDYVAPTKAIPPPAKWKLAILICSGVYLSIWFQSEAGLVVWMVITLRLAPDLALFIFLWIAVGCLSYGYLDVLNFALRIKLWGEWYGLESWLKQPRVRWVHEYNNVFVDCCRVVVTILEEGFSIFNTPTPSPQKRIQFEHADETDQYQEVLLRINQHIQKGKGKDYEALLDKFENAMEMNDNQGILKRERESTDVDRYEFRIWFRTIDDLNAFMESPIRNRFVRQIHRLVAVPPKIQLLKERDLPDAFTDLINQQGQPVPARSPKKWKVWFLSTISIYLVIKFSNHALPHYLNAWGLDDAHPRLQSLVTVSINVFLNAYFMTPFISMAFGRWLIRSEHDEEGDRREPWRTLNDGFSTMWGKLAMCVLYYGGMAVAWIL